MLVALDLGVDTTDLGTLGRRDDEARGVSIGERCRLTVYLRS